MFTTVEDLPIVACSLSSVLTDGDGVGRPRVTHRTAPPARAFAAFSSPPDARRRVDRRPDRGGAALRGAVCSSTARSKASAWTPTIRRCSGRRSTARMACRARSARTSTGGLEPRRLDRRARAASALGHAARRRARWMAAGPGDPHRSKVSPRTAPSPMIHGPRRRHHRGHRRRGARRCDRARDPGRLRGRARRDVQDRVRAGAAGSRRAAVAGHIRRRLRPSGTRSNTSPTAPPPITTSCSTPCTA